MLRECQQTAANLSSTQGSFTALSLAAKEGTRFFTQRARARNEVDTLPRFNRAFTAARCGPPDHQNKKRE